MRCPKCGFITFDHLETCSKCHKDISAISQQLSGTILAAEPPVFLQFNVSESVPEEVHSVGTVAEDDLVDTEIDLEAGDLDDSSEIEFDFEDEAADAPGQMTIEDEEDFDLPLTDEDPMEIVMDSDEEAVEEEDGAIDFGGLDISDLAPPEEAVESVEETEIALESVGAEAGESFSMGGSGAGLEDLQMGDLDLDIPAMPPAGSATGEKLRPAVKTGTALDDFDFDLGDLVSGKEE
jgi:hypothetical protein